MTDSPYAISLDELEGGIRVARTALVEDQAQPRHADVDRSSGTVLAGGDGAACDGD